jgi:hypothetical protein
VTTECACGGLTRDATDLPNVVSSDVGNDVAGGTPKTERTNNTHTKIVLHVVSNFVSLFSVQSLFVLLCVRFRGSNLYCFCNQHIYYIYFEVYIFEMVVALLVIF